MSVVLALVGIVALVIADPTRPSKRGDDIIFVDDSSTNGLNDGTSWADAYLCLQDALVEADTNGAVSAIWVAAGTYRPDQGAQQLPGDRTASFHLLPGVAIYGGYAGDETDVADRNPTLNRTVLSGDLLGDDLSFGDNSYHVIESGAATVGTWVDGVVVRAGYAMPPSPNGLSGGGVYNAGGIATFSGCMFERNTAMSGGAIASTGGQLTLVNCVFLSNRASVGGARGHSPAYGGAVWCDGGDVVVVNSVLCSNTSSHYGGGISVTGGRGQVIHTTVNRNYAQTGGGITITSFTGNAPQGSVANSILWGNSDDTGTTQQAQIFLSSTPASADVGYTCIQGWTGSLGGTGNIGADPLFVVGASGVWTEQPTYDSASGKTTFVDANAVWTVGEHVGKLLDPRFTAPVTAVVAENTTTTIGVWGNSADSGIGAGVEYRIYEYGLAAASLCINAGSNYVLGLPATDLAGNPRIQHCRADMGAYESSYLPSLQLDCNANGQLDDCDITSASSLDCNQNHRPDECETLTGGDFDADGNVALNDHRALVDCLAGPETTPAPPVSACVAACLTAFDFDVDGDVDLVDFAAFQEAFTGG